MHVIELLPDRELRPEIDVVGVVEQLIELELVGQMRPLDLAVEVRARRLDVNVPDSEVLHVPVELGLKLVAVVRSHGLDPEREAVDDVVDEVDRTDWVCFS